MRASEVRLGSSNDHCELRATIISDALKKPFDLWYQFPAEAKPFISADNGDFLVAALLLPAMAVGEAVDVPYPISPTLYRSVREIQTIFHMWDPTLRRVEVNVPLRMSSTEPGKEVGLFFSLGIDSHYTLWKNYANRPPDHDVITKLIIVHGADLYLSDGMDHVFEQMLSNTTAIANELGKSVICIRTNIGDLLTLMDIRRGFISHETILASVGVALENVFKTIYVASGNTYIDLAPSNAHPLLTPLWSTDVCRFVCDGLEAERLEKTREITQSQLAMNTLRVCWLQEGKYNCGQCAKCLRTMLALHIVGALTKCRTLPHAIDVNLLRKVRLVLDSDLIFMQEILDALGDSDADAEIRSALLDILAKWRMYFERLERARKSIDRIIPLSDKFILVDRDTIRWTIGAGRAAIPFLERDGRYWGAPANDEVAVHEVERLRKDGAKYMVFWWTDYWWLEYYAGLGRYLRSEYRCLLEDDSLMIFDLRDAPSVEAQDPAGAAAAAMT